MINLKNNRGSALILVLVVAGVIAIISYTLPSILFNTRRVYISEEDLSKAELVASDLKEIGKYLLLYEKVIFPNSPLNINRKELIESVSSETFGSTKLDDTDLATACGKYDINAQFSYTGTLGSDNEKVFCPIYLRNPHLNSQMLEDMIFEKYIRAGSSSVLQRLSIPGTITQEGLYKFEINMCADIKSGSKQGIPCINSTKNDQLNFFKINFSDSFINEKVHAAKIIIELYTSSSGIDSHLSERIIKVTGYVEIGIKSDVPGLPPSVRPIKRTETIALRFPTIKDFSIFIPYPVSSDFKTALKFGTGTKIHGRVFFNGDINITQNSEFSALPEFSEIVVLTGNLNSSIPLNEAQIRSKFKKGIITNFSGAKYLFDGPCAHPTNKSTVIYNHQSNLKCYTDTSTPVRFNITHYINQLKNICKNYPLTITNSGYSHNTSVASATYDPFAPDNCPSPANSLHNFITGGYNTINVNGTAAFLATPVGTLNVTQSNASIYGTILGGSINADTANNVNFYSMTNMRIGLTGIPDAQTLGKLNVQASSVQAGIGLPLVNFPLVQSSKESL